MSGIRWAYLVDVGDSPIHDLTLERLEYNGSVWSFEPRLTGWREYFTLPNRIDANHRNDISTMSTSHIEALKSRHTHVYHYMYLRHLHIAFAWDNLQVELRSMRDEEGWYVWVASVVHSFEYRYKIEEGG
jgi:hypothetical protein